MSSHGLNCIPPHPVSGPVDRLVGRSARAFSRPSPARPIRADFPGEKEKKNEEHLIAERERDSSSYTGF